MPKALIDISVMGRILLSEFEDLNPNKFKLSVIYSMLDGKACKIHRLSGKVLRLFQNKKGHSASFRLRVDEAINSLIADRILIRFGTAYSTLKLSDGYLENWDNLKMNLEGTMDKEPDVEKNINLVDSFAKKRADYLPRDTIGNPDEIIWFLKSILINIRQKAGNSCKDCSYFACLAEFCFEHIDPAQLQTHVDFDDESFERLSLRLKSLYHKAADEATRKVGRGRV